MSLLKNLKTDSSIAGEKDSLGGGGTFDSGFYNMTVTMAYLQESTNGALGMFLTLKDKASGRELRSTQYLTGGRDKGQKNYYEDKKNEKQYLPGFLIANSLAMLTTGREISELDTEEKTVSVYNFDAKADVPTKVQVVMDLLNKDINVGVIRQTVNKQKKDDEGVYRDTGETRDENEIDKFFCARDGYENCTTSEIKAKEEAKFYKDWTEKNAGKTRDRTSKGGAKAGAPGAKPAAAAAAKPANSLFN